MSKRNSKLLYTTVDGYKVELDWVGGKLIELVLVPKDGTGFGILLRPWEVEWLGGLMQMMARQVADAQILDEVKDV